MDFPPLRVDLAAGQTLMSSPMRRRVVNIHGQDVQRPQLPVELRSVRGPQLELPTGRIVACDPMTLDGEPLQLEVKPGVYATEALVTTYAGDDRVAFAIVWFALRTPHHFEHAPGIDESIDDIAPGESCGLGVDSGSACFIDPSAVEKIDTDELHAAFRAGVDAGLDVQPISAFKWEQGQAVAVRSGWGDGLYGKALGVDEQGRPVCLVVDFDVVESDLLESCGRSGRSWWSRLFRG